jgi:hypothetical protein
MSALRGLTERLPEDPVRVLLMALGGVLILIGIGAYVLSTGYDEPPEVRRLGPIVPVNEGAKDPADIAANNSPTLVRSPVDATQLVVTNRIDSPRYSCAVHYSSNAGATWSQTPVPAPEGERICYAPDATFGADGTLYMTFVTLRGLGNVPNAAWLTTSDDNGKTFSEPRKIIGRLPFQVRIVADPRRAKSIYVTWLHAEDVGLYSLARPGNPIRAMRSDDGGETWQQPSRVSGEGHQRAVGPSPAIGPDGKLYVLYLDLQKDKLDYEGGHEGEGGQPYQGRWQLVLARSDDRAESWRESTVERALVPSERFIAFIPPFPSLAVDGKSGRIYAAFEDARLGDADVWVWSLPEGAERWERPVRVNDNPRRDRTTQYRPRLAVAPDGRLDVLYYDRRADRRNVLNGVSLQSSFDGGKTFTARLELSDKPFNSGIGFGDDRGLPDIGSRLGLLSTNERALAVWTDTRAGTKESNRQDLAQAVVGFSDPPRLSDTAEKLLRYGGIAVALAGLAILGLALLWSDRPLVRSG